ncbi:MAG: hypothetical protein E6Q53_00955 [Candidatus Moraniibacteriota bacterium]|nr:MAG: hypothetical protein E6Q53_00955 [Candidatus Moranbacteria bacterium]
MIMKEVANKWLGILGRQMGFDLPYFVKNGFWISIRQVIVACSSLAMIATLSRFVDPEVFGKYQLIVSLVSLVAIFSLPGMSTALVQAVAQGRDGFYSDAFGRSLRMSLVGSGLIILIGSYYFLTDTKLGIAVLLIALAFPFISAFGLWEAYFQGRERFDIAARNASILAIIQSLLVCGSAILFPHQLVILILSYAASVGVTNVFFHRISRLSVRNDETDEPSVRFGYFMTKMGALGILSEQIDKLLVGFLLGPAQLAVYAVISFFGLRVKDLVRPFSAMLVPKIVTEEKNFWDIVKTHKKTILIGLGATAFMSVIFYMLVTSVNRVIFSANYFQYSHLSQWYVMTVFLSVPLTAMGYYIYARQNTYAVTLSNTIYHVLRIGLNVVMIWCYGILGAVLAYNLSMLLLLAIYLWGIYHEERTISSPQ